MAGFDVITIGAINMDVSGRSTEGLRLADSNPGIITHAPGGVGRNIAHNLVLLGKKSALVSVVGDDLYGRNLVEKMRLIGLDVEHCLMVEGESSSTYMALMDEAGEMVAAINDMAIMEHITPDFLAPLMPFLQTARALVVDCGLPEATLEFLLRQPDFPPIFVDAVSTVKVMKIRNLLKFIHTFKPNRLEAEILSDIRVNTPADMAGLSAWFHAQGLKNLVVSDGRQGFYYSQASGGSGWVASIQTDIVNVSGAGDATVAGLACGWLEGWELVKSVRFAASCAAITLGSDATNSPFLSYRNACLMMENAYETD